jgi:hypothetical protein
MGMDVVGTTFWTTGRTRRSSDSFNVFLRGRPVYESYLGAAREPEELLGAYVYVE